MLKKIFAICFTIAIYQAPLASAQSHYNNKPTSNVSCAPALQKSLMAIQQLPEARELIAAVQKEGPIRILTSDYSLANQFGAFWDPDRRIIYVKSPTHGNEGAAIGSILFELQNALGTSKIDHLDDLATKRKIDKESYVEAMEYLEYQNSIKASQIAEKGIQMGIFPKGAHLPTYRNFEEHYHYQKVGGHSAWFARNYDELSTSPSYSFYPMESGSQQRTKVM